MRMEKHAEALAEVMEEIDVALKDAKGVNSHQRRLALMLSLGAATLVEMYLHKLGVIKVGSVIKHQWLSRKDAKLIFENQITSPVDTLKNIDEILELAREIESNRNTFAYGSSESSASLINEINIFLKLKQTIESVVGDLSET